MRWPALLLLLVPAAPLAAAEPLHGRRYYLETFVDAVAAGRFHPFDHWTAEPVSLHFIADDRVVIVWGQESEECSVKRRAHELALDCAGSVRTLPWVERADGKVETSLWPGERQVLALLSDSYDEIVAAHEDAFRRRTLPSLAGRWVGSGHALELHDDGVAFWDGAPASARILECLVDPESPQERTACIELERSDGALLLVQMPGALVEAAYPEDLYDDGRLAIPREGLRLVRAERR